MNKIFQYCIALLMAGISMQGVAQNIRRPAVWFSFNGEHGLHFTEANYSPVAVTPGSWSSADRTPDRFDNGSKAISFWDQQQKQTTFVVVPNGQPANPELVKLFGYSDHTVNLPDSFTISCWIYMDSADTETPRKIFYSDFDNSRFALIHQGSDIYLRRIAYNAAENADKHFDYFFGAPASFDAGTGWYHLVLVMGKRFSDKARYCKLYVGKPRLVKYDSTVAHEPRSIPDSLAFDFGAAYAFTGVQSFMNTGVTAWGMGNADDDDPVFGTAMAPVRKIDDFAVWDTVLTEMNVFELFTCQRYNPADACWVQPQPQARKMNGPPLQDVGIEEKAAAVISVFPNPVSGELWVKVPPAGAPGTVTCTLMDLSGRILFVHKTAADKAGQAIKLDDIKRRAGASGIYLLKVVTPRQQKTFKIIVQ